MTISLSIPEKILHLRGAAVLLDSDLAGWYGIETRVLKQTVRRNMDRFPADFMFELSLKEQAALRSQNVTLNKRGQHPKYRAFAFTQEGVAMLSGLPAAGELLVSQNAIPYKKVFHPLSQQGLYYQKPQKKNKPWSFKR